MIPNENENKKECREIYNMVFSMRDCDDYDSIPLKNAAFETIKHLYPNSRFILTFRNDTDNTVIFVLKLLIIMEVALILKS